jgi:hypothetical protein
MHYLLVNLDKKEYIRPIALGAPHGSTGWGITTSYGAYDWQWLILLAQLLELQKEDPPSADHGKVDRVPGSWAGDRVVLLRGDDKSGRLMPEDMRAMKALGATELSDYQVLRREFKDLTNDLKGWLPDKEFGWTSQFDAITLPPDYGWLTAERAGECLEYAESKGKEFARQYRRWLSKQPGLKPGVRALLEKTVKKCQSKGGV